MNVAVAQAMSPLWANGSDAEGMEISIDIRAMGVSLTNAICSHRAIGKACDELKPSA
jgi:hypothetical protein